uniref:Glypican-1 n=1 Tax=Mesocestoides corti TaxID=53468 RepID=A0A5K3F958_MESCO
MCQHKGTSHQYTNYHECLLRHWESVSEVAASFAQSTTVYNDTLDGAAAFLFSLVQALRLTISPISEASNCSWVIDRAVSVQISQTLRILRGLLGHHGCGLSTSRTPDRRGHSEVWEFMKRTKMSGRTFYFLRTVIHLMQSTKALEYLHQLLDAFISFDLGSRGCDRVLMRMHYCSLCAGYPLAHPCPAFCEASLTRCLRPISVLQTAWTNVFDTLYDQLQTSSDPSNLMIKNIAAYAPKAIIEFYRTVMFSVQKMLPPNCKLERLHGDQGFAVDTIAFISRTFRTTGQTQTLRISHKLQMLKHLWTSAPSKICRESIYLSSLTTASSQNCWNGTDIGSYTNGDCLGCDESDYSNAKPSQWSSSNNRAGFTWASVEGDCRAKEVEGASKALMEINCRLKQTFPGAEIGKKIDTSHQFSVSNPHFDNQTVQRLAPSQPRTPDASGRFRYQGGWHQISKLSDENVGKSTNAKPSVHFSTASHLSQICVALLLAREFV